MILFSVDSQKYTSCTSTFMFCERHGCERHRMMRVRGSTSNRTQGRLRVVYRNLSLPMIACVTTHIASLQRAIVPVEMAFAIIILSTCRTRGLVQKRCYNSLSFSLVIPQHLISGPEMDCHRYTVTRKK